MKKTVRASIGAVMGAGTFLIGQLAIENSAWWLTGGTATFDEPLVNAIKVVAAGAAALAVALGVGLAPMPRRRLRL